MSKQPSNSGERPIADTAPDSGEKPFDPSHFGRHQFPDGLREELIKAEKPRIDPKFLQDTVPPNRKPVLTDPDPVVTTPRGGFVAPKPVGVAFDRDAKTLVAAPAARPVETTHDRDATTLIKVPTVKAAPRVATSKTADSPSAPPVDTSRTDPTIILPGVRPKNDKRPLVIGVVAALLVLLIVSLLIRPKPIEEPAAAFASKTVATPAESTEERNTTAPTPRSAEQAATSPDNSPVTAPSTSPIATDNPLAKKKTAPTSKAQPTAKPAPASPKTRPGFDPSKPWEED